LDRFWARALNAFRAHLEASEAMRKTSLELDRQRTITVAPMTGIVQAIDRLFGLLLLIGACLHAVGAVRAYPLGSDVLVWSLSGTLAAGLLAVLNLVRAGRPDDHTLAAITLAGSLAWFGIAIAFGAAIGNVVDPRVLWHAIAALALAGFSLRTLLKRSQLPPVLST
jgi:hypothetical protein